MKILYAIQATGNGHISRAMEILPWLKQYGDVDLFLSGSNSHLPLAETVKFRSQGLSLFYNKQGKLHYGKILQAIQPARIRKEIQDLPVENYDAVINDFEFITAAACAKKGIPSVQMGHQASFHSPLTPRPANRNIPGEYILKNYAKASAYIGFHFAAYDRFIYTPVIKEEIRNAEASDRGYVTVYLPSWPEKKLVQTFTRIKGIRFQIFCGGTTEPWTIQNLELYPVTKEGFNKSLLHCHGIISGGGFETPAEALFLGKKLMVIPIPGHYEQQCNAAALQQMGIWNIRFRESAFTAQVEHWMNRAAPEPVHYTNPLPACLEHAFSALRNAGKETPLATPAGMLHFLF